MRIEYVQRLPEPGMQCEKKHDKNISEHVSYFILVKLAVLYDVIHEISL